MSVRREIARPKSRLAGHAWSMAEIVVIVAGVLLAAVIGALETRSFPA